MPVAQQHHQHSSSLFSSLSSILHMRPQQSYGSASSFGQTSERDDFEVNLAQRLNLLLPTEGATFVNLASLSQAMVVLLSTESDMKALVSELNFPLTQSQNKMVNEYLDRSVKLLDVCNSIRESISEVQKWEVLLDSVVRSLSGKQGNLNEGRLRRARKGLGELKIAMEGEKEEEIIPLQHFRSLRWSTRQSSEAAHDPQRWLSWHGHYPNSSNPARQSQGLGMNLTPPKSSDVETEDSFQAAMYAMSIISVFFLSVMRVAFPCNCRNLILSYTYPRQFLWAAPLLALQENALEDTRRRSKGLGNGILSELDSIFTLVRKLFEITDAALVSKAFPLSDVHKEEMKHLLKQLGLYVEELQMNLKSLDQQVHDLYHRLIGTRMDLLDLVGHANA